MMLHRYLILVLVMVVASGCQWFMPAEGHEGQPCTGGGACIDGSQCVAGQCVRQSGEDGDESDRELEDDADLADGDTDVADLDLTDGDDTDGDAEIEGAEDGDVEDADDSDGDDAGEEEESCTPHAYYGCDSGHVYWYDSCDGREEKKEDCGAAGCCQDDGACMMETFPCCQGVCTDPATGLEWQLTPTGGAIVGVAAQTHCQELTLAGMRWRLPNISELRSLVRKCGPIATGGACEARDECPGCGVASGDVCIMQSCWSEANCHPSSCPTVSGAIDCYWIEGLDGNCSWYWSSSPVPDDPGNLWYVSFGLGDVDNTSTSYNLSIRCVRAEDSDGDVDDEVEPEPDAEESPSFSCTGGVCTDPATGFQWQETPTGGEMTWDNAITHCTSLSLNGTGWRLPNISELRSLVRNCDPIETGGACGVKDVCSPCGNARACLESFCWTDANCNPSSCADNGGPTGCYWPTQLSGTCSWYWSSSSYEDDPYYAWRVRFGLGNVGSYYKDINLHVRCVR